jgi:hypothetical protein
LKCGHFSSALFPFAVGFLPIAISNNIEQASQCKHCEHLAIIILLSAVGAKVTNV